MQQLGFKMHVPNSLTYSDVNFCPGAEEPAVEELQQMPSNKRALFMMSSNAYAKKQITAALSRHPAFRMPTNSLLCASSSSSNTYPIRPHIDPGMKRHLVYKTRVSLLPQQPRKTCKCSKLTIHACYMRHTNSPLCVGNTHITVRLI